MLAAFRHLTLSETTRKTPRLHHQDSSYRLLDFQSRRDGHLYKVASKTKHSIHADILVLVSEFLVVVILSE